MFTRNKLKQVKIGLTSSIVILFTVAYIIMAIQGMNIRSYREVTRSAEIMAKIEEISSRLYELESAQRGYIMTSNLSFLEQYNKNHILLLGRIRELHKLVENNPVQAAHLNVLQKLIRERMLLLKRNILYHHPSTSSLLLGKMVMRSAIHRIELMKGTETRQLNRRMSESQRWSDRSTYSIVAAISITMLLVIVGYFILTNEYAIKVEIEKKLRLYQDQLKEKIEMLDRSNKELEQFAYVASHDLQEPLRKINTFNERINQKLSADVTPDLKDYLERISTAANRMRILIDDLLTYSRITKTKFKKVPVNLEQVLNIVKDTYEVSIQNKQVRFIHHNKLPVIAADKTQMVQLFQNLVSNAIKFTMPSVAPVIEISGELISKQQLQNENGSPDHEQYCKITITDNGIGFDEKDAERMFVVFQRLNGRSEYEGTGIGLSICKKIVENHAGFIKASGTLGKGSRFTVFLPTG